MTEKPISRDITKNWIVEYIAEIIYVVFRIDIILLNIEND